MAVVVVVVVVKYNLRNDNKLSHALK